MTWFFPTSAPEYSTLETDMTTYYTDMLDAPNHAKFSEAMGFVFGDSPGI